MLVTGLSWAGREGEEMKFSLCDIKCDSDSAEREREREHLVSSVAQ